MNKLPRTIAGSTLSTSLIILAILTVSVSVTVSLFGPKEIKKNFFSRSLGDAANSCEEEIHSHFKKRIINISYDNMSSRYVPEFKQYIVYYRVNHTETVDDLPTVTETMVKCIVWESLGYVSNFDTFKP